MSDDFDAAVAGLGVLAEPVRRALYRYAAAQAEAVSREQAAEACGVPLHTAKFHLDRLVDEGLLEAEYRRLSGRSGPGAGRPSKLYRRADREISVSLPARQYDLAGDLLAAAIEQAAATGGSVRDAVRVVSARRGRELGEREGRRDGVGAGTHGRGAGRAGLRAAAPRGRPVPGQLPLRPPGEGAHRAGVRDEPRVRGRGPRRAGLHVAGGRARTRPRALLRQGATAPDPAAQRTQRARWAMPSRLVSSMADS